MPQPEKTFRLIKSIRVAYYVGLYYIYDAALKYNVVNIPVQKIKKPVYRFIHSYMKHNPKYRPWTRTQLNEQFPGESSARIIEILINNGYLEDADQGASHDLFSESELTVSDEQNQIAPMSDEFFTRMQQYHYYKASTFFSLPKDIPSENTQVGLYGVPIASTVESQGTFASPDHLRVLSRNHYNWFTVFQKGVFCEYDLYDQLPHIICKDIKLKDFGNYNPAEKTLKEIFTELEELITHHFINNQIKMVYIGGDHSISFPLVHAYKNTYPDLGLIHLDAHNDLFYSNEVSFDHASTITNLLIHTRLEQVYSFGLRTHSDMRVECLEQMAADASLKERIHLFSLNRLKDIIRHPEQHQALFDTMNNRPYYLSIDLDVLSVNAMGNNLSTPEGQGLEWYELFSLVELLFNNFNIVACDVVEYNRLTSHSGADAGANVLSLLLILIDKLSKIK